MGGKNDENCFSLQDFAYAEIKDFTLGNGEKNMRAVAACVEAVRKHDMTGQVDYIAFDYDICRKLVELCPGTLVQYLNGDKSPSVVNAAGIGGIDYKMSKLTDAWIQEAHELGMKVNVWTVDSAEDMLLYMSKGVDFITTNESERGLLLTGRTYISE